MPFIAACSFTVSSLESAGLLSLWTNGSVDLHYIGTLLIILIGSKYPHYVIGFIIVLKENHRLGF